MKNQYRGGNCLKKGALGQFANLGGGGGAWQERGGWFFGVGGGGEGLIL